MVCCLMLEYDLSVDFPVVVIIKDNWHQIQQLLVELGCVDVFRECLCFKENYY